MTGLGDWLGEFLAEERLPDSFRQTFDEVVSPLADRAAEWRSNFDRPALIAPASPPSPRRPCG